MRSLFRLTFFLIIAGVLSSCEKVIDVQMPSGPSKYVIEGVITNEAGSLKVLVSQTNKLSDSSYFRGVSGADVQVESNGAVTKLNEQSAGIYLNNSLSGAPGSTYHLTVNIRGQIFSAASTMPNPVALDSIYISKDPLGGMFMDTAKKVVSVKFKDPQEARNYYRFVQYVNMRKEKSIFVLNDEFTNGKVVNGFLGLGDDTKEAGTEIKRGDDILVEMQCIDAPVFDYWYSSTKARGSGAEPSNPVSNIRGGALGYFSAHTVQRKTLHVP